MKNKFIWFFVLAVMFLMPVFASAKKVTVYLFSRETCPHCQDAKKFLENLKSDSEYKDLFEVRNLDVVKYPAYSDLYDEVAKKMDEEDTSGVPYIIIGDETFLGFGSSSGERIKTTIKETSMDEDFVSPIADIVGNNGELLFEEESKTPLLIPLFIVLGIVALLFVFVIAARSEPKPKKKKNK